MELFQGLTDDQKALLGCGVALFVSAGVMVLSHSVRRWISGGTSSETTYRYQSRAAETGGHVVDSAASDRKAA